MDAWIFNTNSLVGLPKDPKILHNYNVSINSFLGLNLIGRKPNSSVSSFSNEWLFLWYSWPSLVVCVQINIFLFIYINFLVRIRSWNLKASLPSSVLLDLSPVRIIIMIIPQFVCLAVNCVVLKEQYKNKWYSSAAFKRVFSFRKTKRIKFINFIFCKSQDRFAKMEKHWKFKKVHPFIGLL